VEEHGVYFFDPLYYEQTEPFHESLRTCVRDSKVYKVSSIQYGLATAFSQITCRKEQFCIDSFSLAFASVYSKYAHFYKV
jgi:hypothetical protein